MRFSSAFRNFLLAVSVGLLTGKSASAQTDLNQFITTDNSIQNFVRSENAASRLFTGSAIPNFSPHEETVGSRYLYGDWVPGKVVNRFDSSVDNPAYLFNYDKISQSLLLTKDKKSVIEIYKEQIKSFTLKGEDQELEFVRNPLNPDGPFLEVISEGKNYILYAVLKTKFVKSQYATNGIAETGKPYDEYVDQYSYFVSEPGTKNMQPVELKRKSLRKVFAKNLKEANEFMDKNYSDTMDGNFLRALVEHMNAID